MQIKRIDYTNYKPGKKLLLGGGQLGNQFMIVDLKEIRKAENPPVDCQFQAIVNQRQWDGSIEEFTPWLWSWYLAELPKELSRKPIGEYRLNFDGSIERLRV